MNFAYVMRTYASNLQHIWYKIVTKAAEKNLNLSVRLCHWFFFKIFQSKNVDFLKSGNIFKFFYSQGYSDCIIVKKIEDFPNETQMFFFFLGIFSRDRFTENNRSHD